MITTESLACLLGAYVLDGKPVWLITHDPQAAAAWPAWVWWMLAGLGASAAFAGTCFLVWKRRRRLWSADPREGVLARAAATLGLSADQVDSLRMESYRRGLDHPLALVLTPGERPARASRSKIRRGTSAKR